MAVREYVPCSVSSPSVPVAGRGSAGPHATPWLPAAPQSTTTNHNEMASHFHNMTKRLGGSFIKCTNVMITVVIQHDCNDQQ